MQRKVDPEEEGEEVGARNFLWDLKQAGEYVRSFLRRHPEQ